MSSKEIDAAVARAEAKHPGLAGSVRHAADVLTAGEDVGLVHQASVQEFLWWSLPRRSTPQRWVEMAAAMAAVLDEFERPDLASIARSEQTRAVFAAWAESPDMGARAFRAAQAASGLEAPDTDILAWGTVMGPEEAVAMEAVERALGAAIAAGRLTPGAPRWKDKSAGITRDVLTRPLDLPPGQTLANLVTSERVGRWVDDCRHPLLAVWRSSVANRLLNPTDPPPDPAKAIGPVRSLLELAAAPGGAELTQSNYLARATVVKIADRFGWWDWEKPPRSEVDVHQLSVVREAAARLRLTRRRGRHLHVTTLGQRLLVDPSALWAVVATESEDGEDYTRMVTELVGLRLLAGRVESGDLNAEVFPIVASQGWASSSGPVTPDQIGWAVARPLRWWRIFGALDEEQATWERGTGRRLTPQTYALTPDGKAMVLAYLRARAAGPRHSVMG